MNNRLFLILIDGSAEIVIKMPNLFWLPITILDEYAKQYGIERRRLSWSFVREIPNPMNTMDTMGTIDGEENKDEV